MPVLSAVNGAGLTIAVGCAISALCIGLVAAFGIAILHTFERCIQRTLKQTVQAHSGTGMPGYRKYFRYSSLSALLAAISTPHCNLSVRLAPSQPIAAVRISKSIFLFRIVSCVSKYILSRLTLQRCYKARHLSQTGNTDLGPVIQPFSPSNFLLPSASPPSGPTSTFIIPRTRVNVSLF